MKKLIVILFMLFSVSAFAAETGTQVYYGAWSDKVFPAYDSDKSIPVYCGWWSAVNIVNISEEIQEVLITIYTKDGKYENVIFLERYGIYAKHVQDIMEAFGHNKILCKGGFIVKVENTPFTYSVFFLHNGSHSYAQ